jgi:hypothetical protein
MKKIILSLIFAGILGFGYAQNPSNNALEQYTPQIPLQNTSSFGPESLVWRWDSIIAYNTSSVTQRQRQICDNHGVIMSQTTEVWKGTAYVDSLRTTFTYNASGYPDTTLVELWQTNTWVQNRRTTFAYDATGKLLAEFIETWQTTAWANLEQILNSYDANGYLDTTLVQIWQNSAWVNSSSNDYTNDANGNRLVWVRQLWQNNAWVNSSRSTNTFNADGQLATNFYEVWQNNAWENFQQSTYNYDANGHWLSWIAEFWQNNTWLNDLRYTYSYDQNWNKVTELREIGQGTGWVNLTRLTWTYDANGNSVTGKYESWQDPNWQAAVGSIPLLSAGNITYFVSAYNYIAGYVSFLLGIPTNPTDNGFMTVYPNPAQDKITVFTPKVNNDKSSFLSIYDMQGKLQLQQSLQKKQTEIDVSNFSNGMYLLKVITGDRQNETMILKQ